ncbi:FBP domain-containing protein [Bdellovibrio svalbardensis]|uniref:FBP domain-containing protein n=1 Tax=Bdellovibrio svalbardensis TaxID=2972972 RepID=A0ABT6DE97_9BACT|nr:FBP domain-containing protein [Bdellovibrio svalbardensis]MDG0815151.1 FBP domain-containing protein [Bdellovibrio svalbardensis]
MQSQINNFRTENVFSINSEEEFVQAFRTRDQNKLVLPEKLKFPLNVRSYFTWKEPSGVYTYLVFKAPNWDLPRGVAFKRTASTVEPVGGLCGWCNSYGTSDDIGLLSVAMSANVSNSYLICQDLRCIEKIEENTMLAGKNPEKYIADLYYKIGKLFENISGYKQE